LQMPPVKWTVLLRIALVAAGLAAGLVVYRAEDRARREQSSRLPYSVWQELAHQQLIQPDMTMRLSFFAEQLRLRLGFEPPGLMHPDHLYDKAVARYERIVLDPRRGVDPAQDNPYAKYRLGIIYALRDYPEQAQPLFLDAARRDPGNEPVYLALARLFSPNVEDDKELQGVLPQLEELPRWLQDTILPRYYELTGHDALAAAARKTATAHQWSFGVWVLIVAAVLLVLAGVGVRLVLAAVWRGAFGTLKRTDAGQARIPLLVPWRLLDAAEMLVVLFAALVLLGLLGGLAIRHFGQAVSDPVTRAGLIAAQYLTFILIGFLIMMRRVKAPTDQKLSVLGLRVVGRLGPLVYAGVAGYSIYLLALMAQGLIVHSTPLAHLEGLQMGIKLLGQQSAMSIVVYLVLLGLVAPVAEELIFRGFVYPALRRYLPPFTAVGLSAIIFGLMHMNSLALVQIVGIGIVLAVLYERTRSVIPCIVCHAMNNILVFCLILLVNY